MLEETTPVQGEIPLAIVDGKPLQEQPKDLYIPPNALRIFLDSFEGPLDLLLYLIRSQDVDIFAVDIALITQQYIGYIDLMQELDIDLAGEYLLMAAILMEIKSRMLLPQTDLVDDVEQGSDPRHELLQRLKEYATIRKAAGRLDELPRLERDVFLAVPDLTRLSVARPLPEVAESDLLTALRSVMQQSAAVERATSLFPEHISTRVKMSYILARIRGGKFLSFAEVLAPHEGRMGVVASFLAVIELLREAAIEVTQSEPFAPIYLRAAGQKPAKLQ